MFQSRNINQDYQETPNPKKQTNLKKHIYEGRKQSGFEVFVQMCWPQYKLQYSYDLTLKEIEEFNKNCQKWWYDLSEQERMRFQELADKNIHFVSLAGLVFINSLLRFKCFDRPKTEEILNFPYLTNFE